MEICDVRSVIGVKKRVIILIIAAFFVFLCSNTKAFADVGEESFRLEDLSGKTVILHTNDTHGRILLGKDNSVGLTTLAALKDACLAAGAEVLLFDAGDTFRGTTLATYNEGETIGKLMNALGYDAMVTGNHDYEYGTNHLVRLANKLKFPVLGSNVIDLTTNHLLFREHVLIEKNGITYGVFGLSTQATMTINDARNVERITIMSPVDSARMEVGFLKTAGADVIIALGHLGINDKSPLNSIDVLSQVDGIDLFIDGHSHSTLLECENVNPKKSTLLVSSDQYLNAIGVVVVDKNLRMKAYSLTESMLEELDVLTKESDDLKVDEKKAPYTKVVNEILLNAIKESSQGLSFRIGTNNLRMSSIPNGNLSILAASAAVESTIAATVGYEQKEQKFTRFRMIFSVKK